MENNEINQTTGTENNNQNNYQPMNNKNNSQYVNDNKNNGGLVAIIIILLLIVISLLIYILVFNKGDKGKSNGNPQSNNQNINENNNIQRPESNQKTDESKSNEVKSKYKNYTNADIDLSVASASLNNPISGSLSLVIKNNMFYAKLNNSLDLKISGIIGNVKSFVYSYDYLLAPPKTTIFILILTEQNELYGGFFNDGIDIIDFKLINTNLKIKDITKEKIEYVPGESTIAYSEASVVLDNNEIRPIILNDKSKNSDYSDVEFEISSKTLE